MRSGRPLRFLGATLGGWTAIRLAILWPAIETVPDAIRAIVPPLAASPLPRSIASGPAARMAGPPLPPSSPRSAPFVPHAPGDPPDAGPLAASARLLPLAAEDERQSAAAAPSLPPPLVPTPRPQPPTRLAGSAWLIARGGSNGTLLGGQIGGSQAGVRLTYALGESRRFALAARLAAPLHGRGSEAALGIEWQPAKLPLRIVAEQRFALDGTGGGPTAMIVGGVGPTRIARRLTIETYGQAGAIARHGGELFGDGAARLSTPIALPGGLRLDLGAGVWGAAQRGARRLDIGPSAGLAVPVAGKALRLTLDWRERIAGGAQPGSGPALSVGTDF